MTPKPTKFVVDQAVDLIKVFFYGTLKKNQPNHYHLLNRNVKFLSKAITVDKWPLIIGTKANIPFLLNKQGHGKNVYGEIYLMDRATKEFFDEFEGIHDDFYSCERIQVKELDDEPAHNNRDQSDRIHDVFVYMLNNFDKSLLNDKTILFENYSSINDFYPEYKSKLDRADNTQELASQVKVLDKKD